jgi:hypothetical protein
MSGETSARDNSWVRTRSILAIAIAISLGALACAHGGTGSGRVPPREDLLQFLSTSRSVQAIAEAADTEGLLTSGAAGGGGEEPGESRSRGGNSSGRLGDIEDLEAAARRSPTTSGCTARATSRASAPPSSAVSPKTSSRLASIHIPCTRWVEWSSTRTASTPSRLTFGA